MIVSESRILTQFGSESECMVMLSILNIKFFFFKLKIMGPKDIFAQLDH